MGPDLLWGQETCARWGQPSLGPQAWGLPCCSSQAVPRMGGALAIGPSVQKAQRGGSPRGETSTVTAPRDLQGWMGWIQPGAGASPRQALGPPLCPGVCPRSRDHRQISWIAPHLPPYAARLSTSASKAG